MNTTTLIEAIKEALDEIPFGTTPEWEKGHDYASAEVMNVLSQYATQPDKVGDWHHRKKWHEDDGFMLWVRDDFNENHEVYFGSPLCSDYDVRFRYFLKLPNLDTKTIISAIATLQQKDTPNE